MANVILCDGCYVRAPESYLTCGWRKVEVTVTCSYLKSDTIYLVFHLCSQECFNTTMRLNAGKVFQGELL